MENSITINASENVHITSIPETIVNDTILQLKTMYKAADEAGKEAIRASLLTWMNEEKTRAAFEKAMREDRPIL
jgi:hypothetical protein